MTIRVRTSTHRTHTADIDGVDVELYHQPLNDDYVLAERVGERLVVAYLVHDDDPAVNPLDFYSQGGIYTRSSRYGGRGYVTSALGLDSGGSIDIDFPFSCNTYIDWEGIEQKRMSLRDRAALVWLPIILGDDDMMSEWVDSVGIKMEDGAFIDPEFHSNLLWRDLEDSNGLFWEKVEGTALSLFPAFWREIAGPYVVPIHYNPDGNETSCGATTWDGDVDDLPDGVWVADKGAIENLEGAGMPVGISVGQIKSDNGVYTPEYELTDNGTQLHRGTLGACLDWMRANYTITVEDHYRAVYNYAESVCSEYAKWSSGYVYGCVTEVFTNAAEDPEDDPVWEQESQDSCWGFIGQDYAMETLKSEYFDCVVKGLRDAPPPPPYVDPNQLQLSL